MGGGAAGNLAEMTPERNWAQAHPGASNHEETPLLLGGNLDHRVLRLRPGEQIGVPVGQLAAPFWGAEGVVQSAVPGHQPGPRLSPSRTAGQGDHGGAGQPGKVRSPYRLGKPETVVRMPVIME